MNELKKCDQCTAAIATCYAGDPCPDGWAGYYCKPCQKKLRFQIWDNYPKGVKKWQFLNVV